MKPQVFRSKLHQLRPKSTRGNFKINTPSGSGDVTTAVWAWPPGIRVNPSYRVTKPLLDVNQHHQEKA